MICCVDQGKCWRSRGGTAELGIGGYLCAEPGKTENVYRPPGTGITSWNNTGKVRGTGSGTDRSNIGSCCKAGRSGVCGDGHIRCSCAGTTWVTKGKYIISVYRHAGNRCGKAVGRGNSWGNRTRYKCPGGSTGTYCSGYATVQGS
ncbi:hypothetical protein D3C80_1513660 [compost metagenome]